ncbi:hypothetical protein M758_6G080100 [Ceratodon purpureus]|uniref:nucleoside-diphosphate kinase n=1 Tax=Ceratodon purpureus TaxID=3225 RepID=A0A8T0HBY9_CERPU|nr:hypothetical protein KC19_6G084700 [Ceratodon purpureus]KAG0613147.1 hypothetical protein M758_6G080100 [Ceratodon purpureus]
MANAECTFIMIKPDGVQRGLIGDIICRFEKKGFFLKGAFLSHGCALAVFFPG